MRSNPGYLLKSSLLYECSKKAKHCSTKFFTFIRVFLWTTITTKQFFSLMNNFRVGFQTQNAFIGFTTWITFKLFSLMNNLSMSFQTCYSIVAFSTRITFKWFVFIVLFRVASVHHLVMHSNFKLEWVNWNQFSINFYLRIT